MDNMERRFEWLDEHGTRAVGALQLQVSELIKDTGKIEGSLTQLGNKFDRIVAGRWANLWTLAALMVPLYSLVIALLLQH
jgi:hypothetical protein